ncbi:uncharacterized protein MONBRDRAFT_33521 [Monosiga brevicollis MX1]|uniref:Peptidase M3A/M3B catalytic domain-containing protein n=1 Tax=Monosiga brevicollis TaxID=81824 RepID=A9V5V4_MONBE|nr:uncharacterized protein MONBRDRAFT_33521 [Monosiga brevicollis MX1]EDQ87111.1 predicted protein [Monosiga brevicollis MX1]|eukprot:XP_001748054.1 hypothetical protein [Monosiga brevicollis MX1]
MQRLAAARALPRPTAWDHLLASSRAGQWTAGTCMAWQRQASASWATSRAASTLRDVFDLNFPAGQELPSASRRDESLLTAGVLQPQAFRNATNAAFMRSEELLNTILQLPAGSPDIIYHMDNISNELCKILDLTQFLRQLSHHEDAASCDALVVDFEASGIHLPEAERLAIIDAKAASDQASFTFEHMCHRPTELVRVPRRQVPALREFATATHDDDLILNVTDSTTFPARVADSSIREQLFRTFYQSDATTNASLLSLLESRFHVAELSQFDSPLAQVTKTLMLREPDSIEHFLLELSRKTRPLVNEYLGTILHDARFSGHHLNAWDAPFVMRQARAQRMITGMNAYLSLGACMEGIDLVVRRLFGLRLEPVASLPNEVWDPSVIKLHVVSELDDQLVGVIYCDFFRRDNKRNNAVHFNIQSARAEHHDWSRQLPVLAVTLGVPMNRFQPLGLQQCVTLFHEFGHVMHSILSSVRLQNISGTRVAADFAEVPSTLFEKFATEYEFVEQFARHSLTNQPVSEDEFNHNKAEMRAADILNVNESLTMALIDHYLHRQPPQSYAATQALVEQVWHEHSYARIDGVPVWSRFFHLSSYGSFYYSYSLCNAISAKLWQHMFRADPQSTTSGQRLRDQLLSQGGARSPWQLLEGCMAEPPSVDGFVDGYVDYLQESLPH